MSTSPSKLRCAVYTRKSSEEGLDQSFNSLDAQREACEAYIASQASLGWQVLPDLYDDGGISGGTMDRPALQRLLRDIKDRKVDIVVVYKIDRLTRSLMDFAKIVEIFDEAQASFVSVTQAFNTTSSMGRLTLNVLLSFAQFEREVTAERIRDKVAASKKKGMWMGGNIPVGYRVEDRKLLPDEDEAITVRWLFTRYIQLKSINDLVKEARAQNLYRRPNRKLGKEPFGRGQLHYLLSNPVYVGKVRHKQAIYDGEHPAIVNPSIFEQAQALLTRLAPQRRASGNSPERHLILGLLYDEDYRPFTVSYAQNHGRRYRYYISKNKAAGWGLDGRSSLSPWRLASDTIEPIVEDLLCTILGDRNRLATWAGQQNALPHLSSILENAKALTNSFKTLDDRSSKAATLRSVIRRIIMGHGQITIEVTPARLIYSLLNPDVAATDNFLDRDVPSLVDSDFEPITMPLTIKRRGVESRIVLDGIYQQKAAIDRDLVALVGRAHLYLQLLANGSGTNISDLCRLYGLSNSDISRALPIAFLSPKITDAILTGMQPADLTVAKLTRLVELPMDWQAQEEMLSC